MAYSAPIAARGATTAQLRGDIDAGRTGDKVCWPDPAAAPLGTDDEAGGSPTSPQAAAAARDYETGRTAPSHEPRDGVGLAWWGATFALMVAALVGWAALGR